jgi:hypothetical protein
MRWEAWLQEAEKLTSVGCLRDLVDKFGSPG